MYIPLSFNFKCTDLITLSQLEVLIEKVSAAVSCDAKNTKTVCRTVEHMNYFIKVNNLTDLLEL